MRRHLSLLVILFALTTGVQAVAPLLEVDDCADCTSDDCGDDVDGCTDAGCNPAAGQCANCVCCPPVLQLATVTSRTYGPQSTATAAVSTRVLEPVHLLSGCDIFEPPKA